MYELVGVLASTLTIFLGCFAFMYYLMNMFEKRLETKIDHLAEKIDSITNRLDEKIDVVTKRLDEVANEQADQRKRTDQLYQILINLVTNNQKTPQTSP